MVATLGAIGISTIRITVPFKCHGQGAMCGCCWVWVVRVAIDDYDDFDGKC
jgi:hypothetical protein